MMNRMKIAISGLKSNPL